VVSNQLAQLANHEQLFIRKSYVLLKLLYLFDKKGTPIFLANKKAGAMWSSSSLG